MRLYWNVKITKIIRCKPLYINRPLFATGENIHKYIKADASTHRSDGLIKIDEDQIDMGCRRNYILSALIHAVYAHIAQSRALKANFIKIAFE